MAVVQTWMQGWARAATGPEGFWRRERVGDHFRTASATSPLLARMVHRLLVGRPEIRTVVEIGAGEGRLLGALHDLNPGLRLIGIDLRPAPTTPPGVAWVRGEYDVMAAAWRGPAAHLLAALEDPTLVIGAEWLDDLPCPLVQSHGGRWHELLVGAGGRSEIGPPPSTADQDWLDRWWPVGHRPGGRLRAEVGRTRDRAWQHVIGALAPCGGAALMIDYGHRHQDRPPAGSLTGYVGGRQVVPELSPLMNLTAEVAVDAVAAAGEQAGARTEFLVDQRTAAARLLTSGRPGSAAGALTMLQERSQRQALGSTFGDHWWLLQSVERSADLAP